MRSPPERRVELYLRGDTYGTYDAQQTVLSRVNSLEDDGTLADATVEADWQRVRTPEQDSRDGALATYEEFREWARRNSYSLEPAYQRRTRAYMGTDVVHDVVTFPVVSLAVYDGDDLSAVFPCADGDLNYTVQDALAAFEDGRIDEWLARFETVSVDRTEPLLELTAAP
ncbi:HTH domain-containing protein [Haloarculaceae archaeon H-GB11]|nr:HTH domain-containing protein [Haloarculaceae archaeon H-GB11]